MALAASPAATPLVTDTVRDDVTVATPGAMSGAITNATDGGAVSEAHSMAHLQLILKRSAARQAALDALVAGQTNPASASYRRWLTPAELAADYGPAPADVATATRWLASHGLTVNRVSPTGMSIDFSGSAADVSSAFHTSLHSYTRAGAHYFSAATTPSIPAALAPVVAGAALNNFFPHPALARAPALSTKQMSSAKVSKIGSSYTMTADGTTFYAVTPSDFATIYNENELFSGSLTGTAITGAGETLVVAELTDINPADWNTFRSKFGLTNYKGTLAITHPGGCADPGFVPGDETEAAIDAEWSGAVAPGAAVQVAACASTETTFGVETTLANLVELGTPAVAISISYGGCEQDQGLTFEQGWTNLIEEGAAEGIPIFVSAGDSGSLGCGQNAAGLATTGLGVNGLATPPYDTAIGGTDFYDTALGENEKYWAAKNSSTGGSAKSYIPEIPWDNSCSNSIIYTYAGEPGAIANCNLATPVASQQNGVGGSGGQSILFAKPDYQATSLLGVPKDGVRDIPDVSFFAANGVWNHFYLECMSNTAKGFGGAPCNFSNATDFLDSAYGGTSFGAPDFAGVAALVAQYDGFRDGNMAPRLYQLAQLQYTNPVLLKKCNATKGSAISTACVFNDVTAGDNTEACVAGTPNCAVTSAATMGVGVLSTSSAVKNAAFPAKTGYDLATGLGTINVANLIVNYLYEQ